MNYLRGALSAASQYYKELPPINPSTLTGAIDVIVVQRQPEDEEGETELACSPFHVRFGKWQVLRPGDKKVKVLVNGKPIPFNMKIGDAGEAFFVFETEGDIPDDLVTSPVLSATQSALNSPIVEPQTPAGLNRLEFPMMQDSDTMVQDHEREGTSELAEPDFLDLDANPSASSSQQAMNTSRLSGLSLTKPAKFGMDNSTDIIPPSPIVGPSTFLGRTANLGKAVVNATVEHEREQTQRIQDKLEGAKNSTVKGYAYARGNTNIENEDKGDEALPSLKEGEGSPPPIIYNEDMVLDMSGYHSGANPNQGGKEESDQSRSISRRESDVSHSRQTPPDQSRSPSPESPSAGSTEQLPHLSITAPQPFPSFRAMSEPPDVNSTPGSSPKHAHSASSEYSWEWGAFPQRSPAKATFNSAAAFLRVRNDADNSTMTRSMSVPAEAEGEQHKRSGVDSPLRSASTYSKNAGSGGVELDDTTSSLGQGGLLELDPEDENKFLLDLGGKTYEFELSLCTELSGADDNEGGREREGGTDEMHEEMSFKERQVSFRQFMKSPEVVSDTNLVIRWNDRYITRKDGSAIMLSLPVWRESTIARSKRLSGTLPDDGQLSSLDERVKRTGETKRSRTTSSWVNWWRSSSSNNRAPTLAEINQEGENEPVKPIEESRPSSPQSVGEEILEDQPASTRPLSQSFSNESEDTIAQTRYAKTLRLTSEQLKLLNLKPGANTVTFSLSASGAIACTSRIFLWDSTDQIVISDIDGTITKSDALGHVFTMIGRDWTHIGVAKLYTDICRNGYKIMYLTSRAIGQADSTRDYLKGINQNNYQLPEGPVIMSPDRLMASLHREVIMRKPELFKMACLRDIQRLFGTTTRNPFYAGFGNRITDALSYRSVNVPSARIFTIDSTGEVKMELLEVAGYKSSYIHMTDLVDQMFPPIHRAITPEFTDFNYWKQPIQEFPLPDLSPPSPALSARSDTSNQSAFSRIRYFSLGRKAGLQFSLPPPSTQKGQTNGPADHSGNEARLRQMSSFERLRNSFLPTPEGEEEADSQSSGTLIDSEYGDRSRKRLSTESMPGSLGDRRSGANYDFDYSEEEGGGEYSDSQGDMEGSDEEYGYHEEGGLGEDEAVEETFDDDLLATGQMENVPYL